MVICMFKVLQIKSEMHFKAVEPTVFSVKQQTSVKRIAEVQL